jgi:death-on-curing protein
VKEVRYLNLADFLLIAEAVLGTRLDLAESALASPSASFGGHEFYPTFAQKAAVLCYHLIRNHPLLDGNKRVGYLCLVEFVERNGYSWTAPAGDGVAGDETVRIIEQIAAGTLDPYGLASWVEDRISPTQG